MNKRDLPWRKSQNPYFIWLSEIILQQTRVDQGTSYYLKFVAEFKDVFALASADEKYVLKLWQGLGYYSRARNLHSTAKLIVEKYDGTFPNQYKELLNLKGVGDYTASAIASIAFDLPHATVDGNVYRVLSRYFGISTPINASSGPKEFRELAQYLLDPKKPGTHNQAVMEFGALVCKPKKPDCNNCVLNDACYALQHHKVAVLPVKINKIKIRKRYLNYFVLNNKKIYTRIQQRQKKDIWQHLYEFPLYETGDTSVEFKEIEPIVTREFELQNAFTLKKFNDKPVIHKLTHQTLYTTFWIIQADEQLAEIVKWDDLETYALPVLLQNFVDKYQNQN